MVYDKDLKFSEKYNWWTDIKDKENIDFITKISYVMAKGKSNELFFIFNNLDIELLKIAFNLIKDDWYSLKTKRKNAIENLIKYRENNL